MQQDAVTTLQRELDFNDTQISSELDSQTLAAIEKLLHTNSKKITTPGWQSWPQERKAMLALQLSCKQAGFTPGLLDGWWGHTPSMPVASWPRCSKRVKRQRRGGTVLPHRLTQTGGHWIGRPSLMRFMASLAAG